MIVSRNLLGNFWPDIYKFSAEELEAALFKVGIEVERMEKIVSPEGLCYGIINSFEKVEGSDNLNLCQVNIPSRNCVFGIVCGAKNVRADMKVVVALPGAKLLNGSFEIGSKKIFGVESHGMLCAYSELYRSEILSSIGGFEKKKIIDLGDVWDIDKEFEASDLWLDDWIFELTVPANRGDLHSAWALSMELLKVMGSSMPSIVVSGNFDACWKVKRMLLTNNQADNISDDLDKNLLIYVYLAFNEDLGNFGLVVRKKSKFFNNFAKAFLDGKTPDLTETRNIPINIENIHRFFNVQDLDQLMLKMKSSGWLRIEKEYALVPSWREDITTERDIINEIIICLGWHNVVSLPIPTVFADFPDNSHILSIEEIRKFWRAWGFYECTTFNLQKNLTSGIAVNNPLSNRHVYLREHALWSLMEILERNFKEKRELRPVFEIFESHSDCDPKWVLSVVVPFSEAESKSFFLNDTRLVFDLCDLRALLKKSLRNLNLNFDILDSLSSFSPFMDKSFWGISSEGVVWGHIGHLSSSSSLKMLGLWCEIPKPLVKDYCVPVFSKYPPSSKDVSIEIDDGRTDRDVFYFLNNDLKVKMAKSDFVSAKLIEKYVGNGFVSYLLRVKFQSYEKTLSKEDINKNLLILQDVLVGYGFKIR